MKKENCETKTQKQINVNYVLMGVLALAVAYGGWITLQKQKVVTEKEVQYVTLTVAKDSLQAEKDSTLNELKKAEEAIDSLKTNNSQAKKEISNLKTKIRNLIYKNNVTAEDLNKARDLISALNAKIEVATEEYEKLKVANTQLTDDKNQLTIERNQLSKVLDSTREEKKKSDDLVQLGSTLSVSNVNVSGINSKGKVTDVTAKVTNLRITFTVNENKISPSGKKTVHLVFNTPLGNTVGNHNVISTEDGEIVCTGETTIDYTTGLVKDVSFDVSIDTLTIDGVYHIILYENGKKISQKSLGLKKKKILGFL